ncbi:hypothetical protein HK405_004203, partial [Cladochytrium tenue]
APRPPNSTAPVDRAASRHTGRGTGSFEGAESGAPKADHASETKLRRALSRVAALEKTVELMNDEHRLTLKSLHDEIRRLQDLNSECMLAEVVFATPPAETRAETQGQQYVSSEELPVADADMHQKNAVSSGENIQELTAQMEFERKQHHATVSQLQEESAKHQAKADELRNELAVIHDALRRVGLDLSSLHGPASPSSMESFVEKAVEARRRTRGRESEQGQQPASAGLDENGSDGVAHYTLAPTPPPPPPLASLHEQQQQHNQQQTSPRRRIVVAGGGRTPAAGAKMGAPSHSPLPAPVAAAAGATSAFSDCDDERRVNPPSPRVSLRRARGRATGVRDEEQSGGPGSSGGDSRKRRSDVLPPLRDAEAAKGRVAASISRRAAQKGSIDDTLPALSPVKDALWARDGKAGRAAKARGA